MANSMRHWLVAVNTQRKAVITLQLPVKHLILSPEEVLPLGLMCKSQMLKWSLQTRADYLAGLCDPVQRDRGGSGKSVLGAASFAH